MYARRILILAVLVLSLCATVALGADTGRIVWSSTRADDGKLNLWGIDPDGTNAAQITITFDAAMYPAVSPDGSRIAFCSADSGTWYIYLIDSDGKHLSQFTDFSSAVPDWSQEGIRLIFNSDHDDEPKDTPDLWAMDIDGTNLTELVDNPPVADFNAQWSPDGMHLLFATDRNKSYDLYVLEVSSGRLSRLTPLGTNEWNGRWSPDGSEILFVSDKYKQTDLFVMKADGTAVCRLTSASSYDSEPAWSPDGERIVFMSDRAGHPDLWIINADGRGLRQLTNDTATDRFPDWGW